MSLITANQNGITVLAVAGSLDAVTVNDFDAEWKKILDAGSAKLLIDLKDVGYISSAGLRGILMLAKAAKLKNIRLAFCGMQSMVADMFKLSGFYSILSTYPTRDAALTAMAS